MALAWFVCPYKRGSVQGMESLPVRYCAMDDFTTTIKGDNGAWAAIEILGNHALVKVRASAGTLTTIAGTDGFLRVPNHTNLNDTLGDLTANQRNAILNKLEALGYSNTEVMAALPANWQAVTLRQVLNFARTRRLKPRYIRETDTIICDGPVQPTRSLDEVDALVQSGQ